MDKILIAKLYEGTTVSMSNSDYNRLTHTYLKGCPFKEYTAYDLLRDLIQMYSWKLQKGITYTISEFLNECNDIKAIAYKDIYIE